MVIGSHVIFGTYGFWLPNDPRGSWSDFVGSWELLRFGDATKTAVRRSVAGAAHDRAARLAAKAALARRAVRLSGVQARAVARGFAAYVERSALAVWACAVLPDHVHLVIGRHRTPVEPLIVQLKGHATRRLVEENMHPFQDAASADDGLPKCFARGAWKVFLDSASDVRRAIAYVEGNPEKEGLRRQRWGFVTGFEG